MLSPALLVMYTRTVSADAGNAAKATKSHSCLKPMQEPIELLELMAVLLPYGTSQFRRRRAKGSRLAAQASAIRRVIHLESSLQGEERFLLSLLFLVQRIKQQFEVCVALVNHF
jgi:hypothetical protein